MLTVRILLVAFLAVLCTSFIAVKLKPQATVKQQTQAIKQTEKQLTPQEELELLVAKIREQNLPATDDEVNRWRPIPINNAAEEYRRAYALIDFPEWDDSKEDILLSDENITDEAYEKYLNEKKALNLPFLNDNPNIDLITDTIPPQLLPVIQKYLNKNKQAIKVLSEIDPTLPCRWAGNAVHATKPLMQDISNLLDLIRFLKLDSLLAVHEKDYERAYRNLLLILQIGTSLEHEPIETIQLVRSSIYAKGLNPLDKLTQVAPPTEAITQKLLTQLKQIQLPEQFAFVWIAHRPLLIPASIKENQNKANSQAENTETTNGQVSTENIVMAIRLLNRYINALKYDQTEIPKLEKEIASLNASYEPAKNEMGYCMTTWSIIKSAQAQIDTARAALAAHLFKFHHGTYPQSLSELVPYYLPEIKDRYRSNHSLGYIHDKDNNSIVVYSTGEDEINNQGREYESYDRKTLGKKPHNEFDSKPLTDITFTIGNYQRVRFPEVFVKDKEIY